MSLQGNSTFASFNTLEDNTLDMNTTTHTTVDTALINFSSAEDTMLSNSSVEDICVFNVSSVKNTRNKLQTKVKKEDPILPPCRVCESKASGYHFGVISCEACKVFYRRYLRNNTPYICSQEENCEIRSGRRGCSFCRVQKCISLGMSKDGVQKGRYTVEKKSRTIREVKMLKEKERQAKEKEEHLLVLCETMTKIYSDIRATHTGTLSRLSELQDHYIEYMSARQLLFGLSKPLPFTLHEDLYKQTGLDVDNRWAAIETCLKCCEHELTTVIVFLKRFPGFNELSLTDQCTLIQASCLILNVIISLPAIDPARMLFTCIICGRTFGEYELRMIHRDRDITVFRFIQQLKDLCLTDEETAVVILYIFYSGYVTPDQLEQPELVQKLRKQATEGLHFVVSQTRGHQADDLLEHLSRGLVDLAEMVISHKRAANESIACYPDLNPRLPAVVLEIYGEGNTVLQDCLLE